MKKILLSTLISIIVIHGLRTAQCQQVTGIRVKTIFPFLSQKKNFIDTNYYDIYHLENMILYRLSVDFDSSVNGVSILHEERFEYFIFKRDSSYGLKFSTVVHKQLTISRVLVDSITSVNNKKFEIVDSAGRKLDPDSIYTTSHGELVHVFRFKKTEKYPEDFTHSFYYSKKFNGYSETLSEWYDTTKGLKLFKAELRGHGGYYKKAAFQMPARTYVYQFEMVSDEDIRTAAIYFDKYKDYYKKK